MNTPDVEAARVCVRTGTRALLAIADALGQKSRDGGPTTAHTSKAWYDATRTRLNSIGLPLKPAVDAEPQWREFQALRGGYQDALSFVARQAFAPMEEHLIDMQSEAAIQV
jgi:hypothetical protein